MRVNINIRQLVLSAVLTSLVFIITWSFRLPIPATNGGYINLGDVVIYIAAYAVGGGAAIFGAALGSALADLLAGATVYILPTLIIKGLMALAAISIIRKNNKTAFRYIAACAAGGAVMTFGYWLYEYLVFDLAYSLVSLPLNLLQWLGGTVIASALFPAVKRLEVLLKKI